MGRRVTASLLALLASLVVIASPLEVYTDKSTYSPGETVTIMIKGKPNTTYGIEVRDPEGAPTLKEVDAGPDGGVVFKYTLPAQARLGTYTVYVSGGGERASTSFSVAAAAAPPPAAPAPSAAAAAALSSARSRLQILLRVLQSLDESLGLLKLENTLAEVWAAVGGVNSTLQRAEAAFAAGDYGGASGLASSAHSDAGRLISRAFELAVSALRGYAGRIEGAAADELVLLLLKIVGELLNEVSPLYVDTSLRAVDHSARVLLAAAKLANATQLELTVRELSAQLDELRDLLSEAQSRLREVEGELTSLRSANEQLSRLLSETQNALSAARSEAERLAAENEQLRSRSSELEKREASLSSQLGLMTGLAAALPVLGAAAGFAAGYLLRGRKLRRAPREEKR